MTDQMTTHTSDGGGKADAAKEVAERAAGRAGDVAGEAGAQAKAVAHEAKDHVRDLLDRSRRDIDEEAKVRSRQAASTVRSFADRMGALAEGNPDEAGPLADLAREGRERLAQIAERLDDGPAAVLDDVRDFARRKPVLFLASAGALGFLAGRMVRAGREPGSSSTSTSMSSYGAPDGTGAAMPAPDVPPMAGATLPAPTVATDLPAPDVLP